MNRVAYITSRTPWGREEAFVLDEIVEHIACGWQVFVFPVNPGARKVFHGNAASVLPTAQNVGYLDRNVRHALGTYIRKHPGKLLRVLGQVVRSSITHPRALINNLVVFPKSVYIADQVTRLNIRHIHAHWLTTPTTCAYVAAELAGITYSFTCHAWDIHLADNMIVEKIKRSAFAITSASYNVQFLAKNYPGADLTKVRVLNTGIRLENRPSVRNMARDDDTIRLICVANLVEKKGHHYLLKAFDILKAKGHIFECLFVGDGPLRNQITEEINQLNLQSMVKLLGAIPHEEVLSLLSSGSIDIFVLPSIILPNGATEGLAFSLMEAMARELPVISTNTAGTAELLVDGAGLIVEERNIEQLADAIETLITNPELRKSMGRAGRTEVESRYDLQRNAVLLRAMFSKIVEPNIVGVSEPS
jgi:glycosyltransferase involved in cell wall biosynthesis